MTHLFQIFRFVTFITLHEAELDQALGDSITFCASTLYLAGYNLQQ